MKYYLNQILKSFPLIKLNLLMKFETIWGLNFYPYGGEFADF
jgi:hypothetical protein